MVLAESPVRLLVNDPLPVPLVVLLLAVVGPLLVFQQTPLAVMVPPPSELIVPPLEAVVDVMEVTTVVEPSVGALISVTTTAVLIALSVQLMVWLA